MSLLRHPFQGHATTPRHDSLHVEDREIADQLNTLEQLIESFGTTPEIVKALADGLAEMQTETGRLSADDTRRIEALWRVVARYAVAVQFTSVKKRWFGARAEKQSPNG
jgi:hypothetical protein